ncbi:peptide chain release factor N(5)-glutamine methyltransferase [Mycoplasma sp. U97]|uniref:peptide chain release factor N(5)-glutamine methyltransferase n=1 Tax=Mycoplasma tauri TaxID=547987 RepID=UPI001CBB06F1|nr:peptide chain release factor N(5)-glutamine methyltransferase [Mycoplasma tauri]MBZ4212755.1 peptide chain release factor N(5)-glutamine methyltransferase [Mycoplasma tauri]
MPTIDDLLLEKKRYGLPETISDDEKMKIEQGMPVQYILGFINYSNLEIKLNRKVLIPRYETDEMVHLITKKYLTKNMKVLDLCCGSGFIGLSLKKNEPSISVVLSDIDDEAIIQTNENSKINFSDLSGIKIVKSDCFKEIKGKFDLIVSNPPYVAYNDEDAKNLSLTFEPKNAIFAPDNGWYFYQKIINEAGDYLNDNGLLIFEINPKHIDRWLKVKGAKILKDMSNKYRFVFIKKDDLIVNN